MKTPDDISESLRRFVEEAPVARVPHIALLRGVAAALAPGSIVLDVGAGDAPYRELFDGLDYRTADWEETIYAPERTTDYVGAADNLPLPDDAVDAVVCTQVLEHVPDPGAALLEFLRVLRPGGRVAISTPLTWFLHETPHDYYRYTSYGLTHLLHTAGFEQVDVRAMNDSPSTIAELLRHLRWNLGTADDGHNDRREAVGALLAEAAGMLESVSWLDTQWRLPLSFFATAHAPGGQV